MRDPYVYNYYLDIQREIMPKTVLDVKYVGTAGHKLFRAEDVNRQPGSLLPLDTTVVDNFGRTLFGLGGRLNQNYGRLRVWENAVNSNYNSFQGSLKRQMSHGLLFNMDYTYSHSIDDGSTWHSGATTANGAAGGEGFTSDPTLPGLDRGNSIYDIRHRLVFNYVWQLPGQNLKGALGAVAGGWSLNGIWQFQSGAHFEPFTSTQAILTGDCSQNGINTGACVNIGRRLQPESWPEYPSRFFDHRFQRGESRHVGERFLQCGLLALDVLYAMLSLRWQPWPQHVCWPGQLVCGHDHV